MDALPQARQDAPKLKIPEVGQGWGNGLTETSSTEVCHRQSGWWDFLKVDGLNDSLAS